MATIRALRHQFPLCDGPYRLPILRERRDQGRFLIFFQRPGRLEIAKQKSDARDHLETVAENIECRTGLQRFFKALEKLILGVTGMLCLQLRPLVGADLLNEAEYKLLV